MPKEEEDMLILIRQLIDALKALIVHDLKHASEGSKSQAISVQLSAVGDSVSARVAVSQSSLGELKMLKSSIIDSCISIRHRCLSRGFCEGNGIRC